MYNVTLDIYLLLLWELICLAEPLTSYVVDPFMHFVVDPIWHGEYQSSADYLQSELLEFNFHADPSTSQALDH
jgi:hypothetical protein